MIPVILITHGNAAAALKVSAEMIIGAQETIYCLDFTPAENTDALFRKISATGIKSAALFLVDFPGGSPYNAAAMYCAAAGCGEVISGLNIPMLLNVLLEREEIAEITQLASLACSSGIEGVTRMNLSDLNQHEEDDL
ncbi:hypothetical protein BTJ39_03760 [Izhakiella australiensis]|uniref:PTS EIIA type-4 domain-containing protein n=1 Tax=Izhakiella australiensis TaxID=1926881 RepID=A0A1S8YQQ2_9GAMM|nr:hypothetical protein [Izhakiella australiensis]OON41097.1 hypothetical protein BTJ39_03760 [Izhakiella australiensis]